MRRIKFLVISILSLLNIIFIPSFDVWGGLFPSHPDDSFFDIIGTIFTDSDAFHYWSTVIVVSILLPSIVMLIGALFDNKPIFLLSSLAGILLWFRFIISYINQYEISELFDFDDGSIAIGTWLSIILFIFSLIAAITSNDVNKHSSKQKSNSSEFSNKNVSKIIDAKNTSNQIIVQYGDFCPNCGSKQNKPSNFCGECGFKFE